YSALLSSASKRSLSQASDALEIISRRKISLLEYSECVTRWSNWATSAWKERVCFWLISIWEVGRTNVRGLRDAGDYFKAVFRYPKTAQAACDVKKSTARLDFTLRRGPNRERVVTLAEAFAPPGP